MEILHSCEEEHKILRKNINEIWTAENIKYRDCTNTGDKEQYVCRRYRVFESEVCIPVRVAQMVKKREIQGNSIVH